MTEDNDSTPSPQSSAPEPAQQPSPEPEPYDAGGSKPELMIELEERALEVPIPTKVPDSTRLDTKEDKSRR